ncbi:MAG: cytochrome D1 domain-containing protein [Steroidobacteraceae bacterium]
MTRHYALGLLLTVPLAANADRIYQTNSAGDTVDIIDSATNAVVLQVKDIEVPHGVTFAPDGKRAYISCESENTLWATDTRTGKLLGKAALSGHPNNIAISKDGRRVFVGILSAPGAVEVIDTVSMKSIKTIAVKGGVHNAYVTRDGKYVVAGSIVGKILTVIDAQTLEPVWELPFDAGVRPIAFETGSDGSTARMFVQLSDFHGFAVVDFKTHSIVSRVKLPDAPSGGKAEGGAPSHGIGVSPDGKTLWVDSSIANAVFVYSLPDLKVLGYVPTEQVPDWIAFAPDGKRLYVANSGSNSVSVIDATTRRQVAVVPVGEVPKRNGVVATL